VVQTKENKIIYVYMYISIYIYTVGFQTNETNDRTIEITCQNQALWKFIINIFFLDIISNIHGLVLKKNLTWISLILFWKKRHRLVNNKYISQKAADGGYTIPLMQFQSHVTTPGCCLRRHRIINSHLPQFFARWTQ
jgi:hypothetical protein